MTDKHIVLQADAVTKSFVRGRSTGSRFDAVKNASLVLEAGKLTEIIGHSGSGKTTLLNMAAGLLAPTSGKILLGGTDLYSLSDKELSKLRNEKVGVVPQGQTALSALTVLENVLLPYSLYRKDLPAETVTKAENLLSAVGLNKLKDSMPSELSGGELRRMSIVRAMIMEPQVLMADEPTGDLDKENTEIVLKMLRDAADSGTSVLLVTHEADAEKYADQIYQMEDGKLAPKSV